MFKRLVDEAAEHLPVTLVPFFRGESLINQELVSLLAYAKKEGPGAHPTGQQRGPDG